MGPAPAHLLQGRTPVNSRLSHAIVRRAAVVGVATLGLGLSAYGADQPAPPSAEALKLGPTYLMGQDTRPAARADRGSGDSGQVGAFFNSFDDDYSTGAYESGMGMFQTDLGGVVQGPHTPRFGIYSPEGDFVLRPSLLLQLQAVFATFETLEDDDRETEFGGEVARARMGFDGHAFSDAFYYRMTADIGSVDGGFELEDAFIAFPLGLLTDGEDFADGDGPGMALRLGQFKAPFSHGFNVDDSRQLSAGFTEPLSEMFLGGMRVGRVQGVSLLIAPTAARGGVETADPREWRAEVSVYQGAMSANTNFEEADFGVAGRFEYLVNGDWRNYRDFTALGTEEQTTVVGLGATWNQTGDSAYRAVTGDIQYETTEGMAFYAALFAAPELVDGEDYFNFGAMGQVAYLLDNYWEPFGRIDLLVVDDELVGDDVEDTYLQLTGGVNRYLGREGRWGHGAKITFDVSVLPDGSIGYPRDADFDASDEFLLVARGQFQLAL